ncbi:putative repeat protein (TIGR01451 family), partial [Flavobacterium aquidurense]
ALPSGYTLVSATPSKGTWSSPNWTIGSLANGANATLTVIATVKATGVYANTATITGIETDPTPANNTATSTPVPVASADLRVVKTVDNATPSVGSNVTFTITASNNGPSDATGVSVADALPSGYTLVSATPSKGTWSSPNWTIGNLANGANATLTVIATVKATGSYANTATITGTEPDPTPGNNTSTSTPGSVASADLAVTKTVSNSTPSVGTNVTFTITASNNGPSDATGVSIADALPSGYTLVSAIPNKGSWSAPNWTIGSLANGANATLTVIATVKATGSYANTATITGTEPDPTPANNTATSTPVPVASTDLRVVKTVDNATPSVGTNVTFTITASNNGPSDATGVSIADALPSGYTLVSATPSKGTWSSPNWTIGSLANGANATLTVIATVKATGVYANTATITGTEPDPTPGNNTSTSTPGSVASADLAVTKTVSNSAPSVGTNVTFTITASNNGPSDATGVSIADALPSGYTLVSATPSKGTWSSPNWTIGSLANGANATLTVIATVKATGSYANTATITGTEPDPTPANNTATSTPVPVASTDLRVVKTVDNATPSVGTNVTFTITASNNGPSDATGVSVADALPSGYTLVSANPNKGTWSSPNWTIGSLANGANATLTVIATVKATGSYANTATITGTEPDPTPANNTATSTPVPVASTDLRVVKTVDNATPSVGTNVTFTITASNNGPSDATGVSIADALPSGYTLVSATPSKGTWSSPNWTIGSLANGANATLTVVATVKATGSYANTATITGTEPDPTSGNNTSTSTPSVIDAIVDTFPTQKPSTTVPTTVGNVTTNDTLNGVPVTADNTDVTPITEGPLSIDDKGILTLAPNTPSGSYPITYTICEVNPATGLAVTPGNCDSVTDTVVVLNPIDAVVDTFPTQKPGTTLPTTVGNVTTNDTLNGVPVTADNTDVTPVTNGPLSIDDKGV